MWNVENAGRLITSLWIIKPIKLRTKLGVFFQYVNNEMLISAKCHPFIFVIHYLLFFVFVCYCVSLFVYFVYYECVFKCFLLFVYVQYTCWCTKLECLRCGHLRLLHKLCLPRLCTWCSKTDIQRCIFLYRDVQSAPDSILL